MPRIRSIKPDFFLSEDVAELPLRARLTWIGLWTHSDDHGRSKDNVKLIKAAIWPLDDVTFAEVEADLKALAKGGRIVRYSVAGARYLAVVKWHDHQAISKPGQPKHPAPEGFPPTLVCSHGTLPEDDGSTTGTLPVGGEGKGREQGGDAREPGSPPPSRCARHLHSNDDQPCGACGNARRRREDWNALQKLKPTPSAVPLPTEPRCQADGHERYVARNCKGCAADRKAAS
jgi:hypothetical protein